MKIKLEIADSLFEEAQSLEGLRGVVERRRRTKAPFTLRDGSFAGKGRLRDISWPAVGQAIYAGRGE